LPLKNETDVCEIFKLLINQLKCKKVDENLRLENVAAVVVMRHSADNLRVITREIY